MGRTHPRRLGPRQEACYRFYAGRPTVGALGWSMTMRVRDLMQKDVLTLSVDATLDIADGLMRVDRVRHIPILSGTSVVGLVSERDLLRAAVSSLMNTKPSEDQAWLEGISVAEVMTREVLTAHPDADVSTAAEMMLGERIGCLPVVEDGELVGLLSETDCLRHFSRVMRDVDERIAER